MSTAAIDTHMDPATLRHAFSAFPSGVTALAAIVDGEPLGMVASSFTSVSLEPPLISVCIARTSRTWQRLRGASQIGVSVFAEHQDSHCYDIVRHQPDAFEQTRWHLDQGGALILREACASFRCDIEAEHEAGDHDIVVLRIFGLHVDHGREPMVFHRSRFSRLARNGRVQSLRPAWLSWDDNCSGLPAGDVWG